MSIITNIGSAIAPVTSGIRSAHADNIPPQYRIVLRASERESIASSIRSAVNTIFPNGDVLDSVGGFISDAASFIGGGYNPAASEGASSILSGAHQTDNAPSIRPEDESTRLGSTGFTEIIAALPEQYQIDLSSSWDTPFSSAPVVSNIASKLTLAMPTQAQSGIANINRVVSGSPRPTNGRALSGLEGFGVSSRLKAQSMQVYQGGSGIEFSVDFIFRAINNTTVDVKRKHIALMKLVCPSEVLGQLLLTPGPNLADNILGGRKITLKLGTYITLEDVIVKSVSSTIHTLCGEDGIPHLVRVGVTFSTWYATVTNIDIDKMFQQGGGNGGAR